LSITKLSYINIMIYVKAKVKMNLQVHRPLKQKKGKNYLTLLKKERTLSVRRRVNGFFLIGDRHITICLIWEGVRLSLA